MSIRKPRCHLWPHFGRPWEAAACRGCRDPGKGVIYIPCPVATPVMFPFIRQVGASDPAWDPECSQPMEAVPCGSLPWCKCPSWDSHAVTCPTAALPLDSTRVPHCECPLAVLSPPRTGLAVGAATGWLTDQEHPALVMAPKWGKLMC